VRDFSTSAGMASCNIPSPAASRLPLPEGREWSGWEPRHGRGSREVAVERCGSSRDTIEVRAKPLKVVK
jgi:hypothetical protein